MAYKSKLFEELNEVHETFQVSSVKKYLVDEAQHIPPEDMHINEKLNFVEQSLQIEDRLIRKLHLKEFFLVKK